MISIVEHKKRRYRIRVHLFKDKHTVVVMDAEGYPLEHEDMPDFELFVDKRFTNRWIVNSVVGSVALGQGHTRKAAIAHAEARIAAAGVDVTQNYCEWHEQKLDTLEALELEGVTP